MLEDCHHSCRICSVARDSAMCDWASGLLYVVIIEGRNLIATDSNGM